MRLQEEHSHSRSRMHIRIANGILLYLLRSGSCDCGCECECECEYPRVLLVVSTSQCICAHLDYVPQVSKCAQHKNAWQPLSSTASTPWHANCGDNTRWKLYCTNCWNSNWILVSNSLLSELSNKHCCPVRFNDFACCLESEMSGKINKKSIRLQYI